MLILILILLGVFLFFKFFKIPKIGNLALVTGGVKTGKSLMSVYCARKVYKRAVRSTKFINFFRKIFKKQPYELPLFYSNVPVGFDYVPVTADILTLKSRVVWGSVMYIDEASLFADSQLIKNDDINNNLLLFNKLCAHFGLSLLMYDTQCIQDVHYSIKRSLSNYFYIHHKYKCLLLPFVILYVQEYRYSDDGTVVAITGQNDLEKELKRVIIPKSTFKFYDCHCYKKIVDGLPYAKNVVHSTKKSDLSCNKIISFRSDFQRLIDKSQNKIKVEQSSNFADIQNFRNKLGVKENEKTQS